MLQSFYSVTLVPKLPWTFHVAGAGHLLFVSWRRLSFEVTISGAGTCTKLALTCICLVKIVTATLEL